MLSKVYNKLRRITTNQLYFPEIDGIRFLAIMLVLLFHIHGYVLNKSTVHFSDGGAGHYFVDYLFYNGDRGVQLFFVLSGFILCLPFAHHYINQGKKISLKKYYLRRLTRLEPPYFIAMTGIFLLALTTQVKPVSVLLPSLFASLIYSHDILYHHTPLLTVVAWSLEIEIQFYLLAPLLFRVLALGRAVRRIVLCLVIALLVFAQQYYTGSFLSLYNYAQFFLTGILLADVYVSGEKKAFFNHPLMVPVSLLALAAICLMPVKDQLGYCLMFPFVIGLFYYIVLCNTRVKKIFSYRFVPIIGGMCYSIYLLHYTLISIFGRVTMKAAVGSSYLPNLFLQIILMGLPVLIISALFYYYVEQPFMSRKWMDMLMKKDQKHGEETRPLEETSP